jgi:ERCC4-type nuclease
MLAPNWQIESAKIAAFELPVLKYLSQLSGVRPTIIVDTREQDPLVFSRLPAKSGTLRTGDYSVFGLEKLFSVERKSVSDLVGCCMGDGRRRFEAELHRLRGYRFKRLLIIGSELEIQQGVPFSQIRPAAVFGTLWAFEARYDCPVVFRSDPEAAARQIELWAFYFSRELVESINNLWRASNSMG